MSQLFTSAQFSSVAQSCPTLYNPMDCSIPGFPVHHQLLESDQTHGHPFSDAIEPSHPLSSPSPPVFNLSQHQVFSNESVLCIRWPKDWSFSFSISPSNEHSELISFRIDWFDLLAGSQESYSPVSQFKSINSSAPFCKYSWIFICLGRWWGVGGGGRHVRSIFFS